MNTGLIFENLYHNTRMEKLKNEEELQWENMRHEKEMVNISEREDHELEKS